MSTVFVVDWLLDWLAVYGAHCTFVVLSCTLHTIGLCNAQPTETVSFVHCVFWYAFSAYNFLFFTPAPFLFSLISSLVPMVSLLSLYLLWIQPFFPMATAWEWLLISWFKSVSDTANLAEPICAFDGADRMFPVPHHWTSTCSQSHVIIYALLCVVSLFFPGRKVLRWISEWKCRVSCNRRVATYFLDEMVMPLAQNARC